jgi:hydrogenase-4 component B
MHMVNHGLFKPLLFLGSGVVIHATGTREIDRMGGLARKLPRVTPLFLIGSLAICGLPPLNGFVGELFLYIGAFTDAVSSPTPVLALIAPLLAIIGGMAVITFVKLFGVIFLGTPRTPADAHGHEAMAMVAPMAVLALLCLVAGICAPLLLRVVEPAVIFYGSIPSDGFAQVTGMVPLSTIAVVNVILLALVLAVRISYGRKLAHLPQASTTTWGCGYLAASPRSQYTGTSFSELAVSLLGVIVAPRRSLPKIIGALPGASRFGYAMTETIIDRVLTPLFENVGRAFSFVRRLQHGQVHLYMLYIFATLFTMMAWAH